ncbi:hypothetical protein JW865_07270 [Candidatus Bathyarchaeota archaeon]|nr:hypothetical protein [Candidatus Bathyarchaeota archaeon]
MKELLDFLNDIGSKIILDESEIVNINNKCFKINNEIKSLIINRSRLVYIGSFLGKSKKKWVPSTILLEEMSKEIETNKIWIDDEAAWLFVCGRDIFLDKILNLSTELKEGIKYLVMNNEKCLGIVTVESQNNKLILSNNFDIGDFLRREKNI